MSLKNDHINRNNQPQTEALKLELTVGSGGDIPGKDDKALQAGLDYLARLGGGTLRILPGHYKMQNSLILQHRVNIVVWKRYNSV